MNLNKKFKSCKLVVADACNLPFKDKSVSLAVSNSFLEHLPIEKQGNFAFEVSRVAQNYWISIPNRFSLFELHYHLPFIGWLEANSRDKIVRILGRKLHYDPINLLNCNELKSLFCDYTEFYRVNIFWLFETLIIIKKREKN